tara:strand:- start:73 stop:690 length:618 start_codon:yes stop_codon:yes gene_type:complete
MIGLTATANTFTVEQYDGPTSCEDPAESGDQLSMHYTGTIDASSEAGVKGMKFDSSRDRDQVFKFTLGKGQVIDGWDKGLLGLCLGAKARLVLPPDMAYGAGGAGADIPGGATLKFDVEVMDIQRPTSTSRPRASEGTASQLPNVFSQIDKDGNKELSSEEVEAFFREQREGDVPAELWDKEDTDSDGVISWEEFTGPKGSKDEL